MSRKRHNKKGGGIAQDKEEGFGKPRDDYKEEQNSKPENRTNAPKIAKEAEEKRRGGRTKRQRGGATTISTHHEKGEDMKHAKHVGHVHGKANFHKGRAPRKAGGRAGSDKSPLSSAHAGTNPKGHNQVEVD